MTQERKSQKNDLKRLYAEGVHEWDPSEVKQWLHIQKLDKLAEDFASQGVDGPKLLKEGGGLVADEALRESFTSKLSAVRLPHSVRVCPFLLCHLSIRFQLYLLVCSSLFSVSLFKLRFRVSFSVDGQPKHLFLRCHAVLSRLINTRCFLSIAGQSLPRKVPGGETRADSVEHGHVGHHYTCSSLSHHEVFPPPYGLNSRPDSGKRRRGAMYLDSLIPFNIFEQ